MTFMSPYLPPPSVQVTKHSGWAKRALYQRRTPRRLTLLEYDALPQSERDNWNLERSHWHSNLPFVHTPQADAHLAAMETVVRSNHQNVEAVRPAILLDGRAGQGKSTTLNHFLYGFYREEVAARSPSRRPGNRAIDVISISARATTSELGLAILLRNFLELPAVIRAEREVTARVQDAIFECGVKVIAIDEFHFIGATTAAGRRMSNYIKDLMNTTPCTFLFAGNNVLQGEVFSADRGRPDAAGEQFLSLVDRRPTVPFVIANGDAVWARTLLAIDGNLRLLKHQDGDLVGHCADLIWAKTGGLWRGLVRIMNQACDAAIRSGQERITPALINSLPADALVKERAELLISTLGTWTSLPQGK